MAFEDLVAAPEDHLERLAEFFELPPDPEFVARATALVRGVPPSRFDDLTAEDQAALTEACAPGYALLA